MEALTVTLFERVGLLLVFAFLLTRLSTFRYLLDRELDFKTTIFHAVIFGIFGIAGAQAGVVLDEGEIVSRLWITSLEDGDTFVGSSLVAIVIAGLLGGPFVGLGAGCITALYLSFLGGDTVVASVLSCTLTGLLAGLTARFFSNERVIAPAKALFIGMFAPILQMCLLLMFTQTPTKTIQLVNTIGIPLVVTNSVAIAVFTTMIRVALGEKEQEAALETKRALKIAEKALPHLRQGVHFQTAHHIAQLLYNELKIAAVSVSNKEYVLAHIGLGDDHHKQAEPLKTRLSQKALNTQQIQIAYSREHIQCQHTECPLQAAIIVPISQSGDIVGLIKLYYRRSQQIRAVDIALAQGISKLISNQLDVVASEKMKALLRDAEMRNLQAQIHPHFLFNTLHLIAASIRVNTDLARHLTVQLGRFMRMNVKLTPSSLVRLDEELEHFNAYLEIVKVRFSDQLTVTYNVADGLGETLIPPFTLQPLVENSIQHGLNHATSGGTLHIEIKTVDGDIHFKIRDNGSGVPSYLLDRLGKQPLSGKRGNGIGLYNVNQRLVGIFGEAARLHFQNLSSGGCAVSFKIPVHHRREEEIS